MATKRSRAAMEDDATARPPPLDIASDDEDDNEDDDDDDDDDEEEEEEEEEDDDDDEEEDEAVGEQSAIEATAVKSADAAQPPAPAKSKTKRKATQALLGVTIVDSIEDSVAAVGGGSRRPTVRVKRYYDDVIDADTIFQSSFRCFRCGLPGHVARDCSNPPMQRPCAQCAGLGHESRNCPKTLCFKCGQMGHMTNSCPNEAVSAAGRPCVRCGSVKCEAAGKGDWVRASGGCTMQYSSKDLANVTCLACGRTGHLCCKQLPKTPIKLTCCLCGGSKHLQFDCPHGLPKHLAGERNQDYRAEREAQRRGVLDSYSYSRAAPDGRGRGGASGGAGAGVRGASGGPEVGRAAPPSTGGYSYRQPQDSRREPQRYAETRFGQAAQATHHSSSSSSHGYHRPEALAGARGGAPPGGHAYGAPRSEPLPQRAAQPQHYGGNQPYGRQQQYGGGQPEGDGAFVRGPAAGGHYQGYAGAPTYSAAAYHDSGSYRSGGYGGQEARRQGDSGSFRQGGSGYGGGATPAGGYNYRVDRYGAPLPNSGGGQQVRQAASNGYGSYGGGGQRGGYGAGDGRHSRY